MSRRDIQRAFLTLSAALCLWELLALVSHGLAPHSWILVISFRDLLIDKRIQLDFMYTVIRTVLAFAIAITLGIPLGIGIGSMPILNQMFSGPLDFLRSLPAFVLLPVFLILFKSGDVARVVMAAFGSGLVITAYTSFGTAHVQRMRIEVAQTYGASRVFILFHVIAREVAPQVADGCKVALSLCLILVIVGEIMLGATHGLGTRVNDSLYGFDLPQMYALIVLIGMLGYLLNTIARLATRKISAYGKHL
jgi:NitT/TauT family transport system permease protein